MFLIVKSDKDCYITNRIIDRVRRTDSNTGLAGTLDNFVLYAESDLSGSEFPRELSRTLIHFNLDPIRQLTGSILDITDSSFKVTLKLTDVYGGQPTPSNFSMMVAPLAKTFQEGIGRDIFSFRDVDVSNWLTASTSGQNFVTWSSAGANASGSLGSTDIDVYSSGTLGAGVELLFKSQSFSIGDEDLQIDITRIVSGVLTNQIPDYGFRISYTVSHEEDNLTLFVKRFASRHSTNTRITPRLLVKFNDSLQDEHENFFFDLSGSLFLRNVHKGVLSNILSGAAATSITGLNSLILTLKSGTISGSSNPQFQQVITASQHSIGNNFVSGVYKAQFAVSSEATQSLKNEIIAAGSGTFKEIWGSLDGTIGYYTGTLVIKSVNRTGFLNVNNNYIFSFYNLRAEYKSSETARIRVFVKSDDSNLIRKSKKSIETKSIIFNNMHYQIKDANNDDIIIPFDTTDNSTLMSTDSNGMYFDLPMSSFDIGQVYAIELRMVDNGTTSIVGSDKIKALFRVV